MINFFSNWAEQIIIAVVITSIIEMLLPNNKNKKYIKIVMGIYILFSIISPMVNKKDIMSIEDMDLEGYIVENDYTKNEEVNQKSMDERLQQLYVEQLENDIKGRVKKNGYDVQYCKVDAVLYGDESKQGINKINLVVSKNNEDYYEKKKSTVNSIDKVEINIGLDKYIGNAQNKEDLKVSNAEVQQLKEDICTYYEIDSSKISVSVK